MATGSLLRRRVLLSGVLALAAAVVVGGGLGLELSRAHSSPALPVASSNPVNLTSRPVPSSIDRLPLVDEHGRPTDLAAYRGRVVVLVDVMTSCQEECPITTGALLRVQDWLAAAHLVSRVAIVEASIDPWRDTPARLAAYRRTFGIPFTMLTGTVANLDRLWSFFGVAYQRVKEGKPPAIDWQTGRPYTFDIVHSDDVFVLGANGAERAIAGGNADTGGKLPASLRRLLSAQGRVDLTNPSLGGQTPTWTPRELLDAIGSVLGRAVPLAPGA